MAVFKKLQNILTRAVRRYTIGRITTMQKKRVTTQAVSIISQNCIGGVFSHDMGWPFLSPTINLFFTAADFVKLACDPKRYFEAPLTVRMGEQYPIGTLDDIEVHFMHYHTCEEAKEKWERRVARVNYDRIVVLSTDRNGFDEAVFAQWKTIPYPKVLFTANPVFAEDENSVFYSAYQQDGMVPDLIPKREFYKDGKLTAAVNRCC